MRLTQANIRRIIKEELSSRTLRERMETDEDRLVRTMQRKLEAFGLEVDEIVSELEYMGLDSLPLQEKMEELRVEFEGYYRVLLGETRD